VLPQERGNLAEYMSHWPETQHQMYNDTSALPRHSRLGNIISKKFCGGSLSKDDFDDKDYGKFISILFCFLLSKNFSY
jgi:hypothetical protein